MNTISIKEIRRQFIASKTYLIMRVCLFFLICSVTQALATEVHSQVATFSLVMKNVSIEDVLDKIESQTEYRFLYNKKMVNVNRKVNVSVHKETVEEILDKLFKDEPVKYQISDRQIVLSELSSPNSVQQDKALSGIVKDSKGEPIPGVSVLVKNTTIGSITDMDGNFQLSVPGDAKALVFSFIGLITKEVTISGQTFFNVLMEEDAIGLEEVVAVGYGTQKKASLTGSVTVIKMNEIKGSSLGTGSVTKAMEGRVPGIDVTYSGSPTAYADVLIRGKGTLNNTSPLYIIDGIPTTRGLNELAPSDIESIQVLKDASAASIYGARAANGVFIITTRKAKQGTVIQFSTALTANILSKNPLPLLNTEEHGRAQWMAARNDGVDPNYGVYRFEDHQGANGQWLLDKINLPEWLDEAKTMRPADTDWQKEISRTGFSQNYNFAFSQGTEKGHALFSVDYFNNQGTTKHNDWNRVTVRINSDYSMFNNRLKIGEDVSLIKMRSTGANYLGSTANIQSIIPVRTEDGIGWGGPVQGMSDRNNPRLMIENNKQNHANDVRLLGSFFANVEIIKNLHFKSTFGVDYVGHWQRNMYYTYKAGFMSENVAKMEQWSNYNGSWTWNNVFNYQFNLKKNDISLMAGQEAIYFSGEDMYAARDGFPIETPDYMYLNVGETNVRNGGGGGDAALNSYFGKINYSYDNRYLATAIVRRDGSSRFGRNNRYATFPSFSVGWALSEEAFMKPIHWITNVKLRYGWGQTGNQEIDYYASMGTYQAHYGDDDWPTTNGTAYDLYGKDSGQLPSGYRRLSLSNPDLKWETTTQNNMGVDFGLFESKLNGSFDYYIKNTKDILVNPPYIATIGLGGGRWLNGASMKNRGWEFILSYTDKIGEVNYSVTANATHNTNRITSLPDAAVGGYPGNGNDQTILGRPFNSMYGWISEGIFQNQQEVEAAPIQPGKGVGRLKFRDVNNDGKIDADDRTWIGVNEPVILAGLNLQLSWKNFDLSMLWRGSFGRMVDVRGTKSFVDFFGFFGGQNYGTRVLDCWSPTHTSSTIPAITASDINNEQRFSSYFVENTSYIKLATLELGYNLPESIGQKVLLKNARFYLQGQNLLTIKGFGDNPFSGFDPQLPNQDFPIPISITCGLSLTF